MLGFILMFHRDDDFSFGVSFFNIPERFSNLCSGYFDYPF